MCRGVVIPDNPGPDTEAFRRGLRELGYVEGENILIDYRYIQENRDHISQFVALRIARQ